MCGIAALFETNAARQVEAMTDKVRHRGPDGGGVVDFSWGALGHRRLAIVDLEERSAQPFTDPSGRYLLTFNGEIYNYLALRNELIALGYTFHTESDTEVLLTAWIAWGERALSKLNGMFSFVLVDLQERDFVAVRDRFGIKPLYYKKTGAGIAFASEIKQFTALKGWRAEVNKPRVCDYLLEGITDHTEETLFFGVYQIPGGSLYRNGEVRRWYNPEIAPFTGSFEEASDTFISLLQSSLQLRMRADVSVGSCLSGGLDSSTISCLLAKEKLQTFSAFSEEKALDESAYIRCVTKACALQNISVTPKGEEFSTKLAEIIYAQDEPFATTSVFAQWKVFEAVQKSGVKVMLDGQGADELMGGYHSFFGPHYFELLRGVKLLTLFKEIHAAKKMHPGHIAWRRLAALLLPESAYCKIRTRKPTWLAEELSPFAQAPQRSARSFRAETAQQTLRTNLPMLLHLEDRDSMAHSVEARVPYLDHRLVEFTLSLPHHFQIERGVTKKLLRHATKGILPEKVRQRTDKLGFSTPQARWMKEVFFEKLQPIEGFVTEEIQKATAAEQFRAVALGEWLRQFFSPSCHTSRRSALF